MMNGWIMMIQSEKRSIICSFLFVLIVRTGVYHWVCPLV